jgi:lipopolysaccharide export system protein LptC
LSRRTWKTDLTLYRDKGQQWHESALRGRVIDDRTLGRPRHMQ